MLIPMRDKNDELVSKDVLDIDFDMSIEKNDDNSYKLRINKDYCGIDKFATRDEAEKELLMMIDVRNEAEAYLRSF